MDSILIEPKRKEDLKLLNDLAKKLGYKSAIISDEEKEDLGLLKAIKKFHKKDYVSEEEVMKSLNRWK